MTSRSIRFADGTTKTPGFMLPGEYAFGTKAPELMEILSGDLEVQLPGSEEWRKVEGGESFEAPGSARFKFNILSPTDYCCSFLG